MEGTHQYWSVTCDTNRGKRTGVFHAEDADHAHEAALEHFMGIYARVQVQEVYPIVLDKEKFSLDPGVDRYSNFVERSISEYKLGL